ncbi:MAG: hypothetical protein ACXWC2_00260 [Ramlibacter sp.]
MNELMDEWQSTLTRRDRLQQLHDAMRMVADLDLPDAVAEVQRQLAKADADLVRLQAQMLGPR